MNDMSLAQTISVWALPLLFAITLHEVSHGWVASLFGDQTARLQGRLTINPIKHIDLMGTIIIPILLIVLNAGFIFGWAKPVPVDARNLKNPRANMVMVSLAGPLANFLMAIFWAGIAKIGFNLSAWFGVPMVLMGKAGIMINIVLGVLNCIPIPPLDGGRALYNLLPGRMAWYFYKIEPYGFIILILLLVTNVLSFIIIPPVTFLINLIYIMFGFA